MLIGIYSYRKKIKLKKERKKYSQTIEAIFLRYSLNFSCLQDNF